MNAKSFLAISLAIWAGVFAHISAAQEKPKPGDEDVYYKYEVRGSSTRNPEDKNQLWSETYDTPEGAEARIKELNRDYYSKDGLLSGNPNKPTELKVTKVPFKRTAPDTSGGVGQQPGGSGRTSQRGGSGVVYRSKYLVYVYELVDGQWVRHPDRTLSTNDEKQARKYMAAVKAVSGWTATWNGPEQNQEARKPGKIEFQTIPSADPKAKPSTIERSPQEGLTGRWKGNFTAQGKTRTMTMVFNADGTASAYTDDGAVSEQGTWTRTGDTLNLSWDGGRTLTLVINGGRITKDSTNMQNVNWSVSLSKE